LNGYSSTNLKKMTKEVCVSYPGNLEKQVPILLKGFERSCIEKLTWLNISCKFPTIVLVLTDDF